MPCPKARSRKDSKCSAMGKMNSKPSRSSTFLQNPRRSISSSLSFVSPAQGALRLYLWRLWRLNHFSIRLTPLWTSWHGRRMSGRFTLSDSTGNFFSIIPNSRSSSTEMAGGRDLTGGLTGKVTLKALLFRILGYWHLKRTSLRFGILIPMRYILYRTRTFVCFIRVHERYISHEIEIQLVPDANK